ncbi:MAG TPA: hypothetical protein VG758_25635 [Hyphomicrobiaceae bacterium]|nr:hypothetical protein [Hyphomicrobiaceae bacterium]
MGTGDEGPPADWGGGLSADELKLIFEAFDDAWTEAASEVGSDAGAIDTARFSLATIVLSLASSRPIDQMALKSAAVDAFRFKHRLT